MISECERLPPPPVESLFDDVYGRMPAVLRTQKDDTCGSSRAEKVNLSTMTELVQMNMIQALNNALDIYMGREETASS